MSVHTEDGQRTTGDLLTTLNSSQNYR